MSATTRAARRIGKGSGARAALLNAKRILTELVRDPAMLGMEILLPVFFLLLTVVGYSREPRPRTWIVGIETAALAARPGLEDAMREERRADGRPAFELRAQGGTDGAAARPAAARPAVLVLRQDADGSLVLEGDAMSSDYVAASNAVEELFDEARPERAGGLRLVSATPSFRSAASDFEAFVPGMMIFAVLLLIPQTAFIVGRETRRGTLDRLAGSGMGAASYLGGAALSQSAFALIQGVILIAISFAVGYPFGSAPFAAAALSLAILALFGLGSVAQGLVVGALAKSDSSAINLGSTVAMLQVFLSGSFFAMPAPMIAAVGRPGLAGFAAIRAYDFLPATHAVDALRRAMLDGGRGLAAPIAAAAAPIAAMAALTLAYFAASAIFFRRRFARHSP
jgi:ABC-2 type transport system permease protein